MTGRLKRRRACRARRPRERHAARRRRAADSPVGDLCLRADSRQAATLRLLAVRQSDARPAEPGAGGAGRRRRRGRYGDWHVRRHAGAVIVRPGERVVAPHDCYGGTYRLFAALAERGRARCRVRGFHGSGRRGRGAVAARRAGLDRDAEQPAAAHHGHRSVSRRSRMRTARWSSWTTRSCRPAGSSRSHSAPTRRALDDQVHQRPQRRRRRRSRRARHGAAGRAALVGELPRAHRLAFDSYLTLRGLRTLHVAHAISTRPMPSAVVDASRAAGDCAGVLPGLPDHPGHDIAARQQRSFGAMVSLELAGGIRRCAGSSTDCECFSLAESLGGVESLVAHPGTMTHAAHGPEARACGGHQRLGCCGCRSGSRRRRICWRIWPRRSSGAAGRIAAIG